MTNLDDISLEDLKVKRVVGHSMEITETDDRWSGLRRFSEWLRLKKGVITPDSLSSNKRRRQVSSQRGRCTQGSTRT